MRRPLIVVKLGGSALTNKKRIYTPRIPVIRRAAGQVHAIMKRRSVVIVHGAGSYGHIPVTKWGLTAGFKNRTQLKGLASTKSKLLEWEMIFDRTLLKAGIPLIPLIASDFVVNKQGRISIANLDPLKHWLGLGCVPTTGGDIVPDVEEGFSILSGDQLASYLAIRLRASKLVFATDVDGVFDSNPNLNQKAKLFRELDTASASGLVKAARRTTAPDVTGGMAGKIREAVMAARKGIPVYFVNLTKGERLKEAALDRKALCTAIVPD